MLAYKVVGEDNRMSTNLSIYLFNQNMTHKELLTSVGEDRLWKILFSKFFKQYKKGSIIKADPKTRGIFCFINKTRAESFQIDLSLEGNSLRIIKVDGIGEPSIPFDLIPCSSLDPTKLIRGRKTSNFIPNGTICFPEVRVLT